MERLKRYEGLLLVLLMLAAAGLSVHALNRYRGLDRIEARTAAARDRLLSANEPSAHGDARDGAPADPPDALAAAAAKRIVNRHLLAPPPPEAFRNIAGVLGDRVLYPDGQSYGVGDNAKGATIKQIGSNWVEVAYEGRLIRLQTPGTPTSPDTRESPDTVDRPAAGSPGRPGQGRSIHSSTRRPSDRP